MELKDDVLLRKSLAQAIFDVFDTMVGVEPCEIEADRDETSFKREISGAMILLGSRNALLSVTIGKEDAAIIVSYMTGNSPEELSDEELYDGVAELVNMVAGRTKALLAGTGYHYSITPPLTIVGENHFIVFKKKAPQIQMEFSAAETKLQLKLTYL